MAAALGTALNPEIWKQVFTNNLYCSSKLRYSCFIHIILLPNIRARVSDSFTEKSQICLVVNDPVSLHVIIHIDRNDLPAARCSRKALRAFVCSLPAALTW